MNTRKFANFTYTCIMCAEVLTTFRSNVVAGKYPKFANVAGQYFPRLLNRFASKYCNSNNFFQLYSSDKSRSFCWHQNLVDSWNHQLGEDTRSRTLSNFWQDLMWYSTLWVTNYARKLFNKPDLNTHAHHKDPYIDQKPSVLHHTTLGGDDK